MRSALYHAPHDVRIEDIDVPEPGPGQVQLRVAHNGVCGSDLHEYFSASAFTPTEPHPQTGAQIPVVLGHEFSGTVTAVGDGVADVSVDDRVAVRPTYTCGECPHCRAGFTSACDHQGWTESGQAELVRVTQADGSLVATDGQPDAALVPSLLTLSDVMATGWHAAVSSRVHP